MYEGKEIKFLIELLRGIPAGNLQYGLEREQFLRNFKRILGISELKNQIDGLSNEIENLKNHNIFKIWSGLRQGGKTTLDSILRDKERIKVLLEKYIILESVLKEQFCDTFLKIIAEDFSLRNDKEREEITKDVIKEIRVKLEGSEKEPSEEDKVKQLTQEFREMYEKGAEASKYFTTRQFIEFLQGYIKNLEEKKATCLMNYKNLKEEGSVHAQCWWERAATYEVIMKDLNQEIEKLKEAIKKP